MFSRFSGSISFTPSVAMNPGSTALMVMLCLASSMAAVFMNPFIPALEVV